MIKAGVSTASLYPLETELALEKLGKSGIKTTEIFFNALCELNEDFVDSLKEIKNRYGMAVDSIHCTMSLAESFMIFSAYERRFYESLRQFDIYGRAAKQLGARYIILHGGKPNGILSDEEYCERYMQIKEQARKHGAVVLQENVRGFRSADAEFLRSMCDILGDEAEFCFDIKQSIRCGYEPMAMVKEFLPHIRHFHISDHSTAGDCLLPGTGKFDFKGFFRYLDTAGFHGTCVTEVYDFSFHDYKEIEKSDKFIQQTLKEAKNS